MTAAPSPFAPSRVDVLVTAWRNAEARHARLNGAWPVAVVHLIMWPCALVAMVMLALGVHGTAGDVAAALGVVALVVAAGYAEALRLAEVALAKAWDAVADHTGLSGADLVRLVTDDNEELAR
jgi:hypothetical protein